MKVHRLLLLVALAATAGCRFIFRSSSATQNYPTLNTTSEIRLRAAGVRRLRIVTPNGRISVAAGGPSIVAGVETSASGPYPEGTLREWAAKVRTRTPRSGGVQEIHADFPRNAPRGISFSASYRLKVPPETDLGLDTDFGAIEARDIRGSVTAQTDNGKIVLARLAGEVRAETGFGSIEIADLTGNLTAKTDNGALTLSRIRGDVAGHSGFGRIEARDITGKVKVDTDNGPLALRNIDGAVTARTGFGEVEAEDISGGVDFRTDNGRISVKDVRGSCLARSGFGGIEATRLSAERGSVLLHTDNGTLDFAGSAGTLTAETDFGKIEASLASVPQTASLKTDNGAIEVTLPNPTDADVEAETDNGSVDASGLKSPVTPQTGGDGEGEWRARIGAGGKRLTLRSGFGSIHLRQR